MRPRFRALPDPLPTLVRESLGCIASRRITVDGEPVGYMSRDAPDRPEDSGWTFFAGDEDDEYTANPENFDVWHLNSIANYDPAIVPFLYALPGQQFERDGDTFVETEDSIPDPSNARLPSGIRVVQGRYNIDKIWRIDLPTPFRQRMEDRSCVLWRPGLTLWIHGFSGATSVAELRAQMSPAAYDVRVDGQRLTYRLREDTGDAGAPSLYAFIVGRSGHLQLGVYFDREADVAAARSIVATCCE